jgi:hypothetical protein
VYAIAHRHRRVDGGFSPALVRLVLIACLSGDADIAIEPIDSRGEWNGCVGFDGVVIALESFEEVRF